MVNFTPGMLALYLVQHSKYKYIYDAQSHKVYLKGEKANPWVNIGKEWSWPNQKRGEREKTDGHHCHLILFFLQRGKHTPPVAAAFMM